MNKLELYYFLKGDVSFEDIIYKQSMGSAKMFENKVKTSVGLKGVNNSVDDANLDNIKDEHIKEQDDLSKLYESMKDCSKCILSKTRNSVVFGKGSHKPSIVFIGEGPGADEDRLGLPFVGRAGKLLDKWLLKYNLSLDNIYIMNAVKCRPPANRDPLPEEKDACRAYFEKQLDILKPSAICALGKHALSNLIDFDVSSRYSDMRGRLHSYKDIPVVATYHPAFILRSPQFAEKVYDDFELLLKIINN